MMNLEVAHANPAKIPLTRWCFACASGELLGLGGAFAVLASARAWGADGFDAATPAVLRAVLGLAVGALEGGVLGALQAWVLQGALPRLSITRFAARTALPAALVWGLVLALMNSGGSSEPIAEPPMALIALVGAMSGLSGGALIGACQALALGPVVGWRRARLWIAASATGWAAGLAVIMVVTTLQTEATPLIIVAALTSLGAGFGGLALGLASWWGAHLLAPAAAGAP